MNESPLTAKRKENRTTHQDAPQHKQQDNSNWYQFGPRGGGALVLKELLPTTTSTNYHGSISFWGFFPTVLSSLM